jgi:hypothetical protein
MPSSRLVHDRVLTPTLPVPAPASIPATVAPATVAPATVAPATVPTAVRAATASEQPQELLLCDGFIEQSSPVVIDDDYDEIESTTLFARNPAPRPAHAPVPASRHAPVPASRHASAPAPPHQSASALAPPHQSASASDALPERLCREDVRAAFSKVLVLLSFSVFLCFHANCSVFNKQISVAVIVTLAKSHEDEIRNIFLGKVVSVLS